MSGAALLTQPIHQQNQFGGSVGGPLIKNKLFYFLTYDGFRRVGRALYYNTNTITRDGRPPRTAAGTVISPTQCPRRPITHDHVCCTGIQFLINVGEAAPSRYAKQDLFFPRLDYHINDKNDAFVDFNLADFELDQRIHRHADNLQRLAIRPTAQRTITSASWSAA